MKATLLALITFRTILSGHKVKWYSDNQGACHIFKKGSMKPDLQDLALDLYIECLRNRLTLDIEWIPRIMNKEVDTISKVIDYDDWETTEFLFKELDRMWEAHTFDRLAGSRNTKLKKFNSKFWCPDTAAVDGFSQDWSKDNYLVPPIHLIAKVIDHWIITKSVGTLVVPWWPSAPFWPLLFSHYGVPQNYVKNVLSFHDTSRLLRQGNYKKSLFGSEKFTSPLGAFRIFGHH